MGHNMGVNMIFPHFGQLLILILIASIPFSGSNPLGEDLRLISTSEICPKDEIRGGICSRLAPSQGKYPKQAPASSPWRIFTWNTTIRPLHSQPIILGSFDGTQVFKGLLVTARAQNGRKIVGHFEPSFGMAPICCSGSPLPNLLESTSILEKLRLPNITVLWTAPIDYLGPVVIVATFWKSSRIYWQEIESTPIQVVK